VSNEHAQHFGVPSVASLTQYLCCQNSWTWYSVYVSKQHAQHFGVPSVASRTQCLCCQNGWTWYSVYVSKEREKMHCKNSKKSAL